MTGKRPVYETLAEELIRLSKLETGPLPYESLCRVISGTHFPAGHQKLLEALVLPYERCIGFYWYRDALQELASQKLVLPGTGGEVVELYPEGKEK